MTGLLISRTPCTIKLNTSRLRNQIYWTHLVRVTHASDDSFEPTLAEYADYE